MFLCTIVEGESDLRRALTWEDHARRHAKEVEEARLREEVFERELAGKELDTIGI